MARKVYENKDFDFDIVLYQHGTIRFSVVYGQQVDAVLNYGQAATKLGEAIMHAAALAGKLTHKG